MSTPAEVFNIPLSLIEYDFPAYFLFSGSDRRRQIARTSSGDAHHLRHIAQPFKLLRCIFC